MAVNYESSSTINDINLTIGSSTISSDAKSAISTLLLGGGSPIDNPGAPVNVGLGTVGSNGQVDIQGPDGSSPDVVVMNPSGGIADPNTGLLNISFSDETLANSSVYFITGNTAVNVTWNTIPRIIVNGTGSDRMTVNGDANTTIESTGGNDTLITSGGDDLITVQANGDSSVSTGAGNDTIKTGTGNDTIDAGTGIDVISYANGSAGYTITNFSGNQFQVEREGGVETLTNAERVHFSDKKVAMDLQEEQNAGMSIQIINVIAAELRDDPEIVGMILKMFDDGISLEALAQHAIDVGWVTQFAGSASNEDLARLAYTNAFGAAPDEEQLDWALSFMDGRVASYTQAEFIAEAARVDENNVTIDLVGLQQTGVEYLG
ncbi:MAG: calcium-binding protein [Pseudohongiella sp.]|uniref:calcium-binding protein n=1 Tax=Pseudohongiella sp. TaxID=1979412 RepID=UPI0034A0A3EE